MGTVYQVHDAARRETVALKTLRWADPAAIYRFKKEFRALADVSHGNLVQLHELVAQGDVWFFTMELVPGQDFVEYVRPGFCRGVPRGAVVGADGVVHPSAPTGEYYVPASRPIGVLDLARLRAALRQLIQGVAALHTAHIVHRDLKPTNVLVTGEGRVVILDFGLAAEVVGSGSPITIEEGLWGTAEFMAPELATGERCTPASDWYSVGALLYEALTGRPPFPGFGAGPLVEKLQRDPPRPDALVPGLPRDLVELCVRLMARAPSARPSDAALEERFGLSAPGVVMDRQEWRAEGAPLVGRERQLARLHEALAAAERGEPVSVCVCGPSGIGKTALIRHFTDQLAAGQRAIVLTGRCFVSETVPYKALDGVIDTLSRILRALPRDLVEAELPADTAALARVFPVLRRVEEVERRAVLGLELSDQRELRRRAFAALSKLLDTMARRGPLVVHIDDLQWADRDSADVLNNLLQDDVPRRVLFLFSFRSEDVPGTPLLRELLARATTDARRRLDIGPLSADDAVGYALGMLGAERPDARDRATAFAQESDGNPFLLDQMVRAAMAGEGGTGGRLVSLSEMVAARLHQMPSGAPELVGVLAVMGQPLDARVAYRAANLEGDERPLVTRLRLAHLLRASSSTDQVDVYHDRIRETVIHELEASKVRDIHRRLVEELERGVAGPETLYEHCLGAGDRSRAATFAAKAAADALAALAFERAALFYRRALELAAEPGPQTASWLIGLGDALASAGRGDEAARAYLDAEPMLDGPAAIEMERRAGQQYLVSGRTDAGLRLIGQVLAKAGLPQLAATPRRALLALAGRRARLALRGLRYRERDESAIPVATLTRIDTCCTIAEGMALVNNIQGAAFQTLHLLLALDAGEPSRIARALAWEAGFAASTGAAARSERLLREAERLAARASSRTTLGLCRVIAAVAALHGGDFARAERLAIEAETILGEQPDLSAWSLIIARLYHVGGLIDEGKIRELCRVTRLFLEDALDRGNRFAATMFRSSWSMLRWLCADDLDGARAALAEAVKQCPEGVFHVSHLYCLVAQGLVDLYEGAKPEAAYRGIERVWHALERSQVLRVHALAVMCLRTRAACAIAAAQVSPDPKPLLEVAARDARRLRRLRYTPISTSAWPEVFEAAIAASRGDRAAALRQIGTAVDRFTECRSAFYLAIARRKKGELLGGDEGRALIADADRWMKGEGIVNPARLAATFVPGFPTGATG